MFSRMARPGYRVVAALFLAAFCVATSAEAATLAKRLEGDWSGSGRLVLPNGKSERIRCHGTSRSSTANSVRQDFRCAGANNNFSFSSSLHVSGGRVRGEWSGSGRSGSLNGSATASSVRANLSSTDGQGSLSASVSGCSQSLRITGFAKEMRSISVSLKKDC